MRQATSAVQATASALRGSAEQINATFASISQAYTNNAARKIALTQISSDAELAVVRQNEQAQYDIALNGVRERSSLLKQLAQTGQIAREQELSGLLALESQRENVELQNLQFLRSTFQQGTAAYGAAQRRMDELTSQSALRRLQLERNATQQIYGDHRRSFEQIGSSVSSSIMGMITGHMKLRDAAQNVLTHLVQRAVQAKVKMVADWLAGVAAQTAGTQAGEAAKTAAVTAGVAARTSAEAAGSQASIAAIIPGVLKCIS